MVEDLHDSERKLTKLLEQYQSTGIFYEVIELIEFFYTNWFQTIAY